MWKPSLIVFLKSTRLIWNGFVGKLTLRPPTQNALKDQRFRLVISGILWPKVILVRGCWGTNSSSTYIELTASKSNLRLCPELS